MTEAEWLACADPTILLMRSSHPAQERKLRLFGCAAVRVVWSWLGEEAPAVLTAAEEYADRSISKAALRRARHAVQDKRHALETTSEDTTPLWAAYWLAETTATLGAYASVVNELARLSSAPHSLLTLDWRPICDRIRDVFGHPLRPVIVNPLWLTSDVRALAAGIYQDRAFDRMPILADALQDAGCVSEDVLNHCRQPGEHVRGCWVVDLLTGRK